MKLLVILLLLAASMNAQCQGDLLKELKDITPHHVIIGKVRYQDKDAIRVTQKDRGEAMAILNTIEFKNGTIELELSGKPLPGVDSTFRGFVGLAFRIIEKDTMQFECFYLRPTNGRSGDQLRRNHATQYVSEPQYPWFKLRKENPGVYESYVDLVPGDWTKVKIVVKEQRAWLYVHDSPQPSLIINDIKHEAKGGKIGLWIGAGTEAHFRNLKVSKDF